MSNAEQPHYCSIRIDVEHFIDAKTEDEAKQLFRDSVMELLTPDVFAEYARVIAPASMQSNPLVSELKDNQEDELDS